MKLHFMPQRSEDWQRVRIGKLTASSASEAVSQPNSKSKPSFDGVVETQIRRTLRTRLALERIAGRSYEKPITSKSILHGIEREPEARYQFEIATRSCVYECGFIEHDTLQTGCSPDGYLGNVDELIEIKSFEFEAHIANVLGADDAIERDIWAQILHGFYVTGAKVAHLVFWNPEVPANLRLHVKTYRAKNCILERGEHERLAEAFLADVDKAEAALRAR